MSILSYKSIAVLPVLAIMLTGCLSTKSYEPSKSAATATLNYEIDPASFYSPTYYIKNGYKERIDIQLKHSRTGLDTIYMNLAELGSFAEINVVEANKPLSFIFEQKMVKGLGDWPLLCSTFITTELEANKEYKLKAKTTVENRRTEKSILGIPIEKEDTSCQVQIVDIQTNKIIADSGMVAFKK